MNMLQFILSFLSIGSLYAIMSVGFALVFSVSRLSNFSHGSAVAVAAYIGYFLLTAGIPWYFALILTMIGSAILDGLIELVALRRIRKNGSSPTIMFVATITVMMLLQNIMTLLFTANPRRYPSLFRSSMLTIGDAKLSKTNLIIILMTIVSLLILDWFIKKTRFGCAIRASAEDRITSSLMGIKTDFVISVVFMIAGVLAGLAGFFMGSRYSVYPSFGQIVGKAFVSTIIGGLGSISGAVLGGFLLGLMEVVITYLLGSTWVPIFSFGITIAFMVFRPQGLAGKRIEDKA